MKLHAQNVAAAVPLQSAKANSRASNTFDRSLPVGQVIHDPSTSFSTAPYLCSPTIAGASCGASEWNLRTPGPGAFAPSVFRPPMERTLSAFGPGPSGLFPAPLNPAYVPSAAMLSVPSASELNVHSAYVSNCHEAPVNPHGVPHSSVHGFIAGVGVRTDAIDGPGASPRTGSPVGNIDTGTNKRLFDMNALKATASDTQKVSLLGCDELLGTVAAVMVGFDEGSRLQLNVLAQCLRAVFQNLGILGDSVGDFPMEKLYMMIAGGLGEDPAYKKLGDSANVNYEWRLQRFLSQLRTRLSSEI